jgi:hypothetical protein
MKVLSPLFDVKLDLCFNHFSYAASSAESLSDKEELYKENFIGI